MMEFLQLILSFGYKLAWVQNFLQYHHEIIRACVYSVCVPDK